MIQPLRPRETTGLLLMAALVALVAAGWPYPVTPYDTRAATSPLATASSAAAPGPDPVPTSGPVRPADPPATPSPVGWRAPLDGVLTIGRRFELPRSPYGPGHRGVDLVASAGAQVRAVGPGTVAFAGRIAGRGVVTIHHGSVRTTYEPVDPDVTMGQPVARGEVIGRLVAGHAGCPTAACLHWGLIDGGRYLDPLGLLRRAPRLLPIG